VLSLFSTIHGLRAIFSGPRKAQALRCGVKGLFQNFPLLGQKLFLICTRKSARQETGQRFGDKALPARFFLAYENGIEQRVCVLRGGKVAQALALLKDGFRYWYEGEEIEQLNKHNERHRMKDPVEENLFVFFRKPLPEDLQVKWLPASVILTKLSIFGKVQVNPHTQLVLVQALEKYGFGTRTNEQETTEYEVVDIQLYQ